MRFLSFFLGFVAVVILGFFAYQKLTSKENRPTVFHPELQGQPTAPSLKDMPREKIIEAFREQSLKDIPLPSVKTPPEIQMQIDQARAKFNPGDFKNIPDPGGQIQRGQRVFESAMVNQSSAREFLTRMKNCVTHLNNQLGMPEAMRLQMQAFCVQNAETIVKKYPALREQFDKEVLKNASPNAVDFTKKMANGG